MKGKVSFARLGKKVDKALEAAEDAVFGKPSLEQRAANFVQSCGDKIEGAVNKAGEKIASVLDSYTLSRLEGELNSKYQTLQTAILKRRDIIRKQPGVISPDTLNLWVEQLNSMNEYIKEYPNSIWNFTDQQKIIATQKAINAYKVIEKIIQNPSLNTTRKLPFILDVTDDQMSYGIISIILGLLCLGTLAMLAITFSPAVLAGCSVLPGVLSIVVGGIMLRKETRDSNFFYSVKETTPRFFGNPDVSKSTEVDAGQSSQYEHKARMK